MKFVHYMCLGMLILSVASFADVFTECPGEVFPKEDIVIFEGFDLVINFTRDPSCKFLTEDIFWVLTPFKKTSGKDIDQKYIKNNFQLHIPSVNVTNSGIYSCMVKTDNSPVTIGKYYVTIIHSLLTDVSLRCTSYNLENMTCIWLIDANVPLPSYNLINWTMSYFIDEKIHSCIRPSGIGTYCTISVILGPPRLVEIKKLGTRSLTVNWLRPLLGGKVWDVNTTSEPYPYIEYKITYENRQRGFEIHGLKNNNITLKNLEPYSSYLVKLYVRLVHGNYYNKWSEPDTLEFTTDAIMIPNIWNATVPGCFWQQFFSAINQLVIMYWKSLPEENQNGKDFRYQILIEEDNTMLNTTTTSVILNGLTSDRNYTITLKGVNEVGKSEIVSRLFITQQNVSNGAMPMSPIIKDVVKFNDSTYYVEWENADNSSIVVFWCEDRDKADIPENCTDGIDWLFIDNGKSNVTLTLDKTKSYRFAISSFADNVSRGMVWSSCEIPQSKSPIPIVRDIKFSSSTDYINITWSLPCEDRFQDIIGFTITYGNDGQFVRQLDACNNKTNIDTCSYTLTNLSPGTKYSIGIALVTAKAASTEDFVSTNNDTQKIAVADKDSDNVVITIITVLAIIIATVLAIIVAVIYTYKKCFRDRLKALKNVQLPPGILERSNNVAIYSSPVCTVQDEFNKLQRTPSPLSIYNSSRLIRQCTSSLDSGLDFNTQLSTVSGDDKSEDDFQEEDLVKKNYMRTFSQASEDVGIQQDELHSSGYVTIPNKLNEDQITEYNEEKTQLEETKLSALSGNDIEDKKPSSSGYVQISNEDFTKKTVLSDNITTTDKPEVLGIQQEHDSRGYIKLPCTLAKYITKQNNNETQHQEEEVILSDVRDDKINSDILDGQLKSHGYVGMSYAFNDSRKEKNTENYPSEDCAITKSPTIEQCQEQTKTSITKI